MIVRASLGLVVAVAVAAAACAGREVPPPPTTHRAPPVLQVHRGSKSPIAPGLRLPGGVTPRAYDLRLEVDPDQESFHGTVEIRNWEGRNYTYLDPSDHG